MRKTLRRDIDDFLPAIVGTKWSGGTFPFTATDVQFHAYTMAGTYNLILKVRDDDGGMNELVITVVI